MFEKIVAAVMFTGCILLLFRVFMGPQRRSRFDAALARTVTRLRGRSRRIGQAMAWPSAQSRAAREAGQAIERARRRAAGDWEGNVYRPKSFKRKKRDLH